MRQTILRHTIYRHQVSILMASALVSLLLIVDVHSRFSFLPPLLTIPILVLNLLLIVLHWRSVRRTPRTARQVCLTAILLLLLVAVAVKLRHDATASRFRGHWEDAARVFIQKDTERIRGHFSRFLGSMEHLAQDLADNASARQAVSDPNIENRAWLFQILAQAEPEFDGEYGLEAFDTNGESVAWSGSVIPARQSLPQHIFSEPAWIFVIPGHIYAYLGVSRQIHDESGPQALGTVVVYRVLEATVPTLASRFGTSSFALEVRPLIRSPFRLEFVSSGKKPADSTPGTPAQDVEISVVLADATNRTLGVARFVPPTYQEFMLAEGEQAARRSSLGLSLVLVAFLCLALGTIQGQSRHNEVRDRPWLNRTAAVLFFSLLLWMIRFGLLALDSPQRFVAAPLFDPSAYASTFLFGLSRSPGDLLLTLGFLLLHILFVWRTFIPATGSRPEQARFRILRLLLLVPFSVALQALFDAYGSGVRSLVRDSTFSFFGYLDLFSSAPFTLTIINLFLLSLSFVLVALLATIALDRLLRPLLPARLIRLGLIASSYAVHSAVWTLLSGHGPSAANRILCLGMVMLVIVWFHRTLPRQAFNRLAFLLGLTTASTFLAFPVLYTEVMSEEELAIRSRTLDVVDPAEQVIRARVENSLDHFGRSTGISESLQQGQGASLHQLAFVEWLKSPLSQINAGSSLTIFDSQGRAVSHFSIDMPSEEGGDPVPDREPVGAADGAFLSVSRIRVDGDEIDLYTGAVPLLSEGRRVGAVMVQIPVVKNPIRALSRLEDVRPFLARPLGDSAPSPHPYGPVDIVVSVYERGILIESSHPEASRGRRAPDWVLEALFDQKLSHVKAAETIAGKPFINFYFPQKSETQFSGMVSVGYEKATLLAELYEWCRLLFTFLFCAVIMHVLSVIIAGAIHHDLHRILSIRRFQSKLIASFTLLIVFPMLFMAFFGRHIILTKQEEWIRSQIENDLHLARTLIEEETIASAQEIGSRTVTLDLLRGRHGPGLVPMLDTGPTVGILDAGGDQLWANRSLPAPFPLREELRSLVSPRLLYLDSPLFSVGAIVPVFDQDQGSHRLGFVVSIRPIDETLCRTISRRIDRDITMYHAGQVIVSTHPELFNSEFISSRLPADAMLNIELLNKPYFYSKRAMGERPYIEGYIPLRDQFGETAGVVSIPTVYQQRQLEQETARTISIILVIYAIIFSITLGLALLLSRRISSPVKELTEGTRQIAAGDLNFQIQIKATDELGELVASFNRMTRELKAGQERLIQAEKDAAWREMARQIAHEVKNPLTPMKLSIQHLMQAYRDRAEHFDAILTETVRMVSDQIDVLRTIASEFSSFARLPRREPVDCHINDILRSSIRLFADSLKGIRLITEYGEPLATLRLDPDEMQRVFVNLIQNALQAMPEGGTLTLRTYERGRDPDQGQRLEVVVEITDTGTGIPEEMMALLFKPSFSTKTEGTGLGLAICKQVITDLGGTIDIHSRVGHGTTVRIVLPASPAGP